MHVLGGHRAEVDGSGEDRRSLPDARGRAASQQPHAGGADEPDDRGQPQPQPGALEGLEQPCVAAHEQQIARALGTTAGAGVEDDC